MQRFDTPNSIFAKMHGRSRCKAQDYFFPVSARFFLKPLSKPGYRISSDTHKGIYSRRRRLEQVLHTYQLIKEEQIVGVMYSLAHIGWFLCYSC